MRFKAGGVGGEVVTVVRFLVFLFSKKTPNFGQLFKTERLKKVKLNFGLSTSPGIFSQ